MTKKLLGLLLITSCFYTASYGQTEKTIYEEHFNDNAKRWANGENAIGIAKVAEGKLFLENKRVNFTASEIVPGLVLPNDNYSIEVKTRWKKNGTKGMYYAYGIVLDQYSFLICANGDRKMMHNNPKDKRPALLVNWGGQQANIKRYGSGDNIMKLVVSNGFAELFVNEVSLYKKEVKLEHKKLLFMNEGLESVEYDDLIIKQIQPIITVIKETLADKKNAWGGFSSAACFSADGKRVYAIRHLIESDTITSNMVICYDAVSGKPISKIEDIKNVSGLAVAGSKKILALSSGKEIRIYDETDLSKSKKTIRCKMPMDNLFFNPNQNILSGIGHQLLANEQIRYTQYQWNVEDGKLISETLISEK